MISFAYPHVLYAFIAIPFIIVIFLFARIARRKKLKRFAPNYDISLLTPDVSKYMPGLKFLISIVALSLIILAAARPYVKTDKNVVLNSDEEKVNGIELMICCDVSNSMLASSTSDINGTSRLQRTKFILDKALDNMRNDRVGMVVFAGDAYLQLPLTPDIYAAKMYVNNLSTTMVPMQGTAIGQAIETAIEAFDPQSQFNKAIIVITDGENFEDDAVEAAKKAVQLGIQVDVIGMGSESPVPIPMPGGGYMMYDGREVETALDAEGASSIAKAGNGIYISGSNMSATDELNTQLKKIQAKEYTRSVIPSDSTDLFPLLCAIALMLLLIDVFIPYTKLNWLRNVKLFSKK